MKEYKELMKDVLRNGSESVRDQSRLTRAEIAGEKQLCRSVFGRMVRFDLSKGLPVVTIKKTLWKAALAELLWFIMGTESAKPLEDMGFKFWKPWTGEDGGIGRLYGSQWRNAGASNECEILNDFGASTLHEYTEEERLLARSLFKDNGFDQLGEVIRLLKEDPASRRMLVDTWQVRDLPFMALSPCHFAFQFFVDGNKLSLMSYQRSCDLFLGVPFNWVCYSILTHMVAQVVGLEPGELIWVGGDIHLYENQIEPSKKIVRRKCRDLPNLVIDKSIKDIDDFRMEHFSLEGYTHGEAVRVRPAV